MNCCKKWILSVVSLFLIVGTSSAQVLPLRCYEVLTGKEPDALELFRSNPNQSYDHVYQINYQKVKDRIVSFRQSLRNQVTVKKAFVYDGEPVYRIDIPSRSPGAKKILITAGVHGNESVTTATILELIPYLAYNTRIRNDFDIVIYPNMNPWGLINNQRKLGNGIDYNRTFAKGEEQQITKLFKASLRDQQFDLGLDLHESYFRDSFFIIRGQRGDNRYLADVFADIDPGILLTSPTGNYPYSVRLKNDPTKIRYKLESEGVATSTNSGTVKSYFSEGLGIPRGYTLESSIHIELGQRKAYYKKLVLSFIGNF